MPKRYFGRGGEFLVNVGTARNQEGPAVAPLTTGGFVIAYGSPLSNGSFDVRARMYDSTGNGIGPGGEFFVNSSLGGTQWRPALAGLPGGGFAAVWTDESNIDGDGSDSDIVMRMFDGNGELVSGGVVSSLPSMGAFADTQTPAIAPLSGGGFVVTWFVIDPLSPDTDSFAVQAQVYDSLGAKVGGEIAVNTITAGSQTLSSVAGLSAGGFVVTWTDESNAGADSGGGAVIAQLFSAAGAKVGGEILVNSVTAGQQTDSSVAALASGGFVVTWTDSSLDGDSSGAGVKAQLFDAAGAKVGGELLVNSVTAGDQDQAAVAALPGGGFVVTWRTFVGPGDYDIKAQAFDASGAKVDDEFLVNSITAGTQQRPSIAVLPSGVLVVTWMDDSGQGGDSFLNGIKARFFDLADVGTEGADSFDGTSGRDVVHGLGGDDVVTFGANAFSADDLVFGGAGDDRLVLGGQYTGQIVLSGDRLEDVETIALTVGADYDMLLQSYFSGVILLRIDGSALGAGDILYFDGRTENYSGLDLVGGAANDVLYGGLRPDRLDGGLGADFMSGARNNDVYVVDNGSDIVVESHAQGIDRVETALFSYTLLQHVENLVGTGGPGSGDQTLRGNALNNVVTGSAFNDALVGMAGADVLIGSAGVDTLIGNAGRDVFIGGTVSSINLIVNGSFETQDGTNDSLLYTALNPGGFDPYESLIIYYATTNALHGWQLGGNGNVELLASYFHPQFNAGAGNAVVNLESGYMADPGSGVNHIIYQDVAGLSAGSAFLLSFTAAQPIPEYSPFGDIPSAVIEIVWNGTVIATITPPSIAMTQYSFLVTAAAVGAGTGGANRLEFREIGAGSDGQGTFLDSVSLSAISDDGGNNWVTYEADVDGGPLAVLVNLSASAAILNGVLVEAGQARDTHGEFDMLAGINSVAVAGSGSNWVLGSAGADQIQGGGGGDVFDGGAGADWMGGAGGNDVYVVDTLGDTVIELAGEGIDEIRTALGSKSAPDYALYVLPSHVENLTGTSAGAQGVRGNALNNVLVMGGGADLIVLDDGGIDSINGGAGNDFIYYGAALTGADTTEGGAGTDTLGLLGNYTGGSAITFTAANLIRVERLALYTGGGTNSYSVTMNDANVATGTEFFVTAASLTATESLVFNGSAETNGRFTVLGGSGGDTIVGGGGSDYVAGNAGADLLYGLGGVDFLIGGAGADQLRGGAGGDFFRYAATSESMAGSVDQILDFQHIDRIDLSAIDANSNAGDGNTAFTFIGSNAFGNVAGQLRATQSGSVWTVEGDTNGDGAADLILQVTLVEPAPLSSTDFIL